MRFPEFSISARRKLRSSANSAFCLVSCSKWSRPIEIVSATSSSSEISFPLKKFGSEEYSAKTPGAPTPHWMGKAAAERSPAFWANCRAGGVWHCAP